MKPLECAAYETAPLGSPGHVEWCLLHVGWTFNCLLKLRKTFRPVPEDKKKSQGVRSEI